MALFQHRLRQPAALPLPFRAAAQIFAAAHKTTRHVRLPRSAYRFM